MGKTLEQRFWEKVEQSPSNDCLNWVGAVNPKKYGKMTIAGKTVSSHRLVYELYVDKIPKSYEIDHLCRNHRCVNTNHLEAVPRVINILRGYSVAAINARKTHCIHGHVFSRANTRLAIKRGRQESVCITCAKIKNTEFYLAHRQKVRIAS